MSVLQDIFGHICSQGLSTDYAPHGYLIRLQITHADIIFPEAVLAWNRKSGRDSNDNVFAWKALFNTCFTCCGTNSAPLSFKAHSFTLCPEAYKEAGNRPLCPLAMPMQCFVPCIMLGTRAVIWHLCLAIFSGRQIQQDIAHPFSMSSAWSSIKTPYLRSCNIFILFTGENSLHHPTHRLMRYIGWVCPPMASNDSWTGLFQPSNTCISGALLQLYLWDQKATRSPIF